MARPKADRKRQRAEKSKTQLKKSTKFLAKGQNVTKTEFKIKPIVLPSLSQIKTSYERSVDLGQIKSHLKHHNEKIQIRGCDDFIHLMKVDKEKIGVNMDTVIPYIATLMQSKIPKVRKAASNVINTFLQNFSEKQIDPYFTHFLMNVRCAMTHVDPNIRKDSIIFLDSLLKNTPNLTAEHSNEILREFLMLISNERNSTIRDLSLNLGDKTVTSTQWRIMVLFRLLSLLEGMVARNTEIEIKDDTITINGDITKEMGIYKSFNKIFNTKTNVSSQKLEVENSVNDLLYKLIPLLRDAWIEAVPHKHSQTGLTYLTEECAMLLNCVTKIFHMVVLYLEKKCSQSVMVEKCVILLKSLLEKYPYHVNSDSKIKSKSKNDILSQFAVTNVKCTEENLLICYLFIKIQSSRLGKLDKFNKFVFSTLLGIVKKGVSRSQINILMKILKNILVDDVNYWSKMVDIDKLLIEAIHFHKRKDLLDNTRCELLKLLGDIKLTSLINNTDYLLWLADIPKSLLEKSISNDTINLMLKLSSRNITHFNENYMENFAAIVDNLPNLQVIDSIDTEKSKQKIIQILYYAASNSHKREIHFDENSPYCGDIKKILQMRSM